MIVVEEVQAEEWVLVGGWLGGSFPGSSQLDGLLALVLLQAVMEK
jgi:hypothetical protein